MPGLSLHGKSFTGIKGIPNFEALLDLEGSNSKHNDSDMAREPQVPSEKLMGDAIQTGGEGFKGTGSRFKTTVSKKRLSLDRGKGQDIGVLNRPRYEDMSR